MAYSAGSRRTSGETDLKAAQPAGAQGITSVTEYHAKYFAHELTKRCASDSVEKLATALSKSLSSAVHKRKSF
jgi:hypothetical protein